MADRNIYQNLSATLLNVIPLSATTLSNQQQFRRNEINEIKDCFIDKIKERELMSKRLSKYIASFDYFDKLLIVLSVTSSSISIALFEIAIESPVGMVMEVLVLHFRFLQES